MNQVAIQRAETSDTYSPVDWSLDAALWQVANVGGSMTDAQARHLWDRAMVLEPGDQIVEIDSFQGRSTTVLALSSRPDVEVTAIDPHAGKDRGPQEIADREAKAEEDHEVFHANLERAGVNDRVRYVRSYSGRALDEVEGDIDLLYIDGAHRYRPSRDGISAWGDRVPVGGTMPIHDAFSAVGVVAAQARLLALSSRFRYVGRSGSLAEYHREEFGLSGRLGSLVAHLRATRYTVRDQIFKVLIVLGLQRWTRALGNSSGEWPYRVAGATSWS